jgi:hypothetical protein
MRGGDDDYGDNDLSSTERRGERERERRGERGTVDAKQ